ncbi:MAG: hypothetical protein ACLGHQ_07420 [Acidimicrobiia bacterium]
MANWARRARKALAGELAPGEEVVAAALLQPDGKMGATVARATGGAIGAALHRRTVSADHPTADSGLAASLGDTVFYGVLTQHRFLVMGQAAVSGRPAGMRAVLRRADIVAFDVKKEPLADRVVITFADGTQRRLEAPGRAARGLTDALFPRR